MLKRKLSAATILAFLSILIICPFNANAATWTTSIGVGDFSIAGFTIWLDVGSKFEFTGLTPPDIVPADPYGGAVPANWANESVKLGAETDNPRIAKFGSSDFFNLFPPNPETPLESGVLFSFDYTGAINNLALVKFPDHSDPVQQLFDTGDIILSSSNFTGDNTGAVFNAVPIPGSILLLGSGLVGLIGIARRKRS